MKFTAWTVSIYSIVCIIPRPLVEIRDVMNWMNEEVRKCCVIACPQFILYHLQSCLLLFSFLFLLPLHYFDKLKLSKLFGDKNQPFILQSFYNIFLHFDLVINRKIDITKQVVFIFLKQFSAVSNISNLVTSSYNGTPNNKTESGEIHEEDGPRVCILVIIS